MTLLWISLYIVGVANGFVGVRMLSRREYWMAAACFTGMICAFGVTLL